MSDGGKGSSPRPLSVPKEIFNNNFDAIFRKPDPRTLDDAKAEDEAFEFVEKNTGGLAQLGEQ